MKRTTMISASALALFAGAALATDLSSFKAPPVLPPPMWAGFYAGVNAGGASENKNSINFTTYPFPSRNYFTNANPAQAVQRAPFWATQSGAISGGNNGGFIGGAQVGYNWRISHLGGIVAGVEADIQGLASTSGKSDNPAALYNNILAPGDILLNSANGRPSSLQYLATIRGRIGYLVTPSLLAYGTGGFAFGGVRFNATTSSLYTNAAGVLVQNAIGDTNFFSTQPGWIVGGGLEWMFMRHWSLKAEYLYYALGNGSISTKASAYPIGAANTLGGAGGLPADWTTIRLTSRVSGSIGRIGINYHFNSDAVPKGLSGVAGPGGTQETKTKSRPRPGIPAGVYGALMNPAGEVRLVHHASYAENRGNYIGTSTISPAAAVTMIPYFPLSVYDTKAPKTLRIVPAESRVQTHFLRLRYGVTDWLTLAVTATLFDKNIDLTTFKGSSGATPLAPWSVSNTGFGDTQVMSLVRLYQDDIHHVHVNLGLSLPTGSISATSTNLAPSGIFQINRCCYGVQIGTGTYDSLFGVTYTGKLDAWSWGFVYRGRVALGLNSYGYLRGPSNEITGWGAYEVAKGLNLTARAAATVWDRVHGSDPLIYGPMQGRNPNYYGGERVLLLGGVEYIARLPGLKPIRLAVEAGAPVYQRLNGPQLGESWELKTALAIGF
jgi:opacity protein-like surface antigen